MEDAEKRKPPIWVLCGDSILALGLRKSLEDKMVVHAGADPPEREQPLLCLILCVEEGDDPGRAIAEARSRSRGAPVLVFCAREDLPLAGLALRAGARGFIHAGMSPSQVLRAVEVALRGEVVAPRRLLEHLLDGGYPADLDALSPRQREVLELVCEGLSYAEIARRLYLSESTVKQHLRSAYRILGVANRTEASRLVRTRRNATQRG